ncbi:MAG: thiamine pyrophosphate-binding protein, partial [Vallitaleaceae bacterium]|nr:thiamine pyrophosphate-binding protein [Vallitaleaceae bacterium]
MKLNGAQILIECLKEQGVDTLFGYPGAATIIIYDELYKNRDNITHILTSHEQGATHAAEGYAKSTNQVGVCIATSGPGSTNLVTGIADAYLDSVPLIAITGNVPLSQIGNDSFQEVDSHGIMMPITKHNYMVKDVNDLAGVVREAFYIAQEGRPGPVHIDIPKNITTDIAEYTPEKPREIIKMKPVIPAAIYEMIAEAKQPLIFAGGGITRADADAEVTALAERLGAPLSTSMMGIGCIPKEHPLHIGFVGMHGSMTSNITFNQADLIICIGVRFSDRVVGNEKLFAKKAKIIQFDIDPAEINKNVAIDDYVIGDAKMALIELLANLEQKQNPDWIATIKGLKEKYA